MPSFRDIIRGIVSYFPEVETPKQKVPLRTKFLWSSLVLILYFVLTEIPLYGVPKSKYDTLAAFRVIFAGASGSVVELGIGPIVTAGIILELLVGSKIIDLDLSDPDDRSYFQAVQKLASIAFIVVTAFLYVIGGRYGTLTRNQELLVWAQLFAGCLILMFLDELSSKWGIGSGISLFILAGIAQQVFWSILSPFPSSLYGNRTVGVIPALLSEGRDAISRPGLPSLTGLIATFIVFVLVAVAYEVKIEFPLAFTRYGIKANYPLRLLYVSNIPIIFSSALFADITIISQTLWSRYRFSTNVWLKRLISILGNYQVTENGLKPVSGLAYYASGVRGPYALTADPVQALVYAILMIVLCVGFAVIWVLTSGMDADSVAEQLVSQEMGMPGLRVSKRIIASRLRRYIDSVTLLGGLLIGVIAVLADFTGAIGSGSGILLAVTIIYSIYESLVREKLLEIYPMARKIFGG